MARNRDEAPTPRDYPAALRQLRDATFQSQYRTAFLADLPEPTVSRIQTGERPPTEAQNLMLCMGLVLTLDQRRAANRLLHFVKRHLGTTTSDPRGAESKRFDAVLAELLTEGARTVHYASAVTGIGRETIERTAEEAPCSIHAMRLACATIATPAQLALINALLERGGHYLFRLQD